MRKQLGWKTILGGLLHGAIGVAEAQGWLPASTADTLQALLVPWMAYGIRDAIARRPGQ